LKSQRYSRISNDKFWRIYGQRAKNPFKYYKRGLKYGDHMLSSGFFASQTWGALYKCWIGFVIAKEKLEWEKIDLYAGRIQKLEKELGIELTDFSNWGID
jgi:hypothetical protein